jgi:hypothetical protein
MKLATQQNIATAAMIAAPATNRKTTGIEIMP